MPSHLRFFLSRLRSATCPPASPTTALCIPLLVRFVGVGLGRLLGNKVVLLFSPFRRLSVDGRKLSHRFSINLLPPAFCGLGTPCVVAVKIAIGSRGDLTCACFPPKGSRLHSFHVLMACATVCCYFVIFDFLGGSIRRFVSFPVVMSCCIISCRVACEEEEVVWIE